jgi:preprotein translocase subunit SecF
MKKTLITVILVILAATAVYFIFLDRGLNYDKQELKKTIDSLNKEIDLKEDTINIKEEEVHVFENQVERAQKTIDVNNVKIKKLNQKHEIQILTIDSYDVNQLEQFFTNRYRDSSSIK